MTPSAKDLFIRALEIEPAAREAFLAQVCGDDAELHLEFQRLLVDSERADSFFADGGGATLGTVWMDTKQVLACLYHCAGWPLGILQRRGLPLKSSR